MAAHPVIRIARLRFVSEDKPQAARVSLQGPITAETAPVLERTLCNLIPKFRLIVLDFSNVDRVDSSGLSALVNVYMQARRANCDFEIDNPKLRWRDQVRNWWHAAFQITKSPSG